MIDTATTGRDKVVTNGGAGLLIGDDGVVVNTIAGGASGGIAMGEIVGAASAADKKIAMIVIEFPLIGDSAGLWCQ